MTGPAIPYVHLPELKLGFLSFLTSAQDPPSIKPFGTLVAIGVYIGSIVAVRHAKQRGLDVDKMNSFIFWVVGLGFVGGHVFDAIFYTPERISQDPLYIVKIWAGLSSFGGFLGAIIGAVAYRYSKKDKILPYVDTVCSAFPLAWVFGRSGCASVHDHPGKISSAWYAVKAPVLSADGKTWENVLGSHENLNPAGWTGLAPGMGRLDLGFIEMALTIPLAVAFYLLWRSKPRAYGFFAGYMCIAYAPVRFILDFLRVGTGELGEADPRYGGLTPAQWACFGLVALGIYIVRLGAKSYGPAPATYEEAQELARAALLEQEGGDDDGDTDQPKKLKTSTKKKKKGKKKRAKVEVKAESKAELEESEGAGDTESESESEPEGKSDAEEKADASAESDAKSASEKPKKTEEKKSETAESGDDHA